MNDIRIWNYSDLIIYDYIDIININLSVLVRVAVRGSGKCNLAVHIGAAFLHKISVTDGNYGNILLSLSVVVGYGYDYGIFSCRFDTVRQINNNIIALSDMNVAVWNNNIGLIGNGYNKGILFISVLVSDCAVVIASAALIVRHNKLSVCIC